jgi:hypothetical protein
MSKFDGHLRELGPVPHTLIEPLRAKVTRCEHLWVSYDPRFSTAHPDSQHIVFRFPDRYPAASSTASPANSCAPMGSSATPRSPSPWSPTRPSPESTGSISGTTGLPT